MKTVAQLLKLKDQKNQEVHQIKPNHMVLEALMKMAGDIPKFKADNF